MSVLWSSDPPSNVGPGVLYTVHPSAQCCPVAVGPFSVLHLVRSNFRISWEPRQFCQTEPSDPIATPPEPGIRILSGGGTLTSDLDVCGVFTSSSRSMREVSGSV